jgi:hypothetical protein
MVDGEEDFKSTNDQMKAARLTLNTQGGVIHSGFEFRPASGPRANRERDFKQNRARQLARRTHQDSRFHTAGAPISCEMSVPICKY